MLNGLFNSYGFSLEAQAGIIANIYHESGLNPWRWQSDRVSLSAGYGLYQFTPARDYIDHFNSIPGYGPNMSVSQTTTGADPADGWAQSVVMAEDRLSKWVAWIWRDYWDRNTYASLYSLCQRIRAQYGSNSQVSLSQFKLINDIYDATFAFLAGYEGPAVPTGYYPRCETAAAVYEYLSGTTPPSPPTPPPTPTPTPSKLKIMFYLKPKWKRGF